MVGCPVGSIHRKKTMEIVIENWCIGCGLCARQCPYDNITMHEFMVDRQNAETGQMEKVVAKKATVCDVCHESAEPSCVYSCPHDAAQRVEPQKFFSIQPLTTFTEPRQ
jgi:Fe-S-cluster-containing hydrogenase component 2